MRGSGINNMTIDEKKSNPPAGIFIFGWLLIIGAVCQMFTYIFSSGLREIYNYLPPWQVELRYWLEWLWRILEISIGVGLLRGNPLWRKIAIILALFCLATLYWKYNQPAYMNHYQLLDDQYKGMFEARRLWEWSFVRMSKIFLIVHYVLNILFYGSLLFYLTRRGVKNYFGIPAKSF